MMVINLQLYTYSFKQIEYISTSHITEASTLALMISKFLGPVHALCKPLVYL